MILFNFAELLNYAVSWLPVGFGVWFIVLVSFMVTLCVLKVIMFFLDLKFW